MTAPEILTIGLPTLSVLVGILLNRSDANRLDARITSEIGALRSDIRELRDDIASIRSDQREFYRSVGEHEVRLSRIEKE